MINYKIRSLLQISGISPEIQYNIENIFNSLTDDKKVEIIDKWGTDFLPKVLKMQEQSEEKVRLAVLGAMSEIRKMVDGAILRDKEEEDKKKFQKANEKNINEETEKILQQKKLQEQFTKIKQTGENNL